MIQPHSHPTYTSVAIGGIGGTALATIEPAQAGGHMRFRVTKRWTLGERPLAAGTVALRAGSASFRTGILPPGEYLVAVSYVPVPGSLWAVSSASTLLTVT